LYFRGSARLESFSIVLKIRRTLVGAEIDEAIAHALAGEAAASGFAHFVHWVWNKAGGAQMGGAPSPD